ncbi:Spy/CpxP family protein refolding chaperone [Shimia sp. FJ5]|uniref:Spy/CpxP family protein refolding chaperone n=1 Tax=Shimia sp. FJ5 TaxID=3079054 RepID=UPI00261459A3|nr:Spy/CpxP family protein refolding chaperone [Shimia sp. FJ5]MDV4143511.1 Spy/CpxP family protein refolding chaperone [Shimia sp. FJ5]
MKTLGLLSAFMAMTAGAVSAQSHGHGAHQPYAGFEGRAIKSLSEEDLAQLRAGKGWGLALAAELNGKPGPAHLLELQAEIGLSKEQVRAIEALFAEMQSEAVAAGDRFIDAEAALSDAFAGDSLDEATLRGLLEASGKARADLRFVHLRQHLATVEILEPEQIAAYNRLRGYASDPCDAVPEGHDPDMWRKHNGCD